ncbi:hypothetical protein CPC08DRAFT_643572 [Agrocybe pediades]|nr:hypothetical protein CPC08DRAFT_643572 [Agrocybe pediades]
MSRFSLRQGKSLPPLCRLPDEILEEIVAELDDHKDLMAFALTSKICAATVVPHHTQYRILRVRHTHPEMWAHLARRADLARNVREVHICDRSNLSAADHYPNKLIDKELDAAVDNAEESVRIRNICKALSHMKRLHTFTWTCAGQQRPTSHSKHENDILAVVVGLPRLEHISLGGRFAMHALGAHQDPDGLTYPVWKLSNLRSLSLVGETWAKPGNSRHICRLLKQSPDLEHLEVPMEFIHLPECHLPKLKRLKMVLQGAAVSTALDRSRALFLQKHPTIEELEWRPLGMPSLAADALPNLKSVRSNRQFIMALEDPSFGALDSVSLMTPPSTPLKAETPIAPLEESSAATSTVRKIEKLDIYALDSSTLLELKCLDPESLRRLKISAFGEIDDLRAIAETFPNIEWLSLPSMHTPSNSAYPLPVTRDKWLEILPMFPNLHTFRGLGLWHSVFHSKEAMHEVILNLVQTCPNLRALDRLDRKLNWDPLKEIVITRTGEFKNHINYSIVKKPDV